MTSGGMFLADKELYCLLVFLKIQKNLKKEASSSHLLCIIYYCVLVAESCPTLCDPMDCGPSGSSVHGILQARILEWVAIPFSRGSSKPRDRT